MSLIKRIKAQQEDAGTGSGPVEIAKAGHGQPAAADESFPFSGADAHDFRFSAKAFFALRQAQGNRRKASSVTIMTRADFIFHVAMHMPEVASRIDEEDFGVLHLEMGAMKAASREAIVTYEFHTLRRHFSFIGYLFEHADNKLYDAILTSYLEPLFVGEKAPAHVSARRLLPASLEHALTKAELRLEHLDPEPGDYTRRRSRQD